MSAPKPANKPREGQDDRLSAFNFTSNFDRARIIFQEIESILESELADTPQIVANYEQNVARVKTKRKRGGPFLIKPLNKSKARKTLNDMEFDPVLGVWVGNDEIMKSFHKPALITNKGRHDKPKTYGKMVWDSKENKWRGNEEDLRVFEPPKRALIANLSNANATSLKVGGMVFDPVAMRWVGNDDALAEFGTISSESTKDDGFSVGTEFQLSAATTQLFADCANRHKASTLGWWQEEKSRTHLHVIRTMSIVRIVRDVKRSAYSDYQEPSDMDIAPEKEAPLQLKSPRAVAETELDDAWDDIGPFDGSAKLKLPEGENPVDIDLELDPDTKEADRKSAGSRASSRAAKRDLVDDEDWDTDFANDDADKLSAKLSTFKVPTTPSSSAGPAGSLNGTGSGFFGPGGTTGPINNMNKKKGDTLKRGFIPPPELKNAGKQKSKSKRYDFPDIPTQYLVLGYEGTDEDDEGGLEFPSEPLQLKLPRTAESDDVHVVDLDGEDNQEEASGVEEPAEPDFEEEEVEEEDWNDVDLPDKLGEPVTKRESDIPATFPAEEKEEWDDFEIPSEKLARALSQPKAVIGPKPGSADGGRDANRNAKPKEDDDWDDLGDIPDDFAARLKKK